MKILITGGTNGMGKGVAKILTGFVGPPKAVKVLFYPEMADTRQTHPAVWLSREMPELPAY